MGTMNAYWSEQVWNDANCRWNANVGVAQNNTNRTHYLDVYVNGGVYFSNSWGTWQAIPTFWSYRFPATTSFQFFLRTWNYANSVETDRANWGPGAFPYPPTPPAAIAPAVTANLVARNTWDITAQHGAFNHWIYVADEGSGYVLRASGGNPTTYRYTMPVGIRSATVLGRAQYVGPYEGGATADTTTTLYSSNSAPSAPTGVDISPRKLFTGHQVQVSWNYSDPNGDAQTKYQLAYWKVLGPGPTDTAWHEAAVITSSAHTGILTVPSPGVYTAMVRTWDWEGNPGAWSAQSPFFSIHRAAVAAPVTGTLVPAQQWVMPDEGPAFAAHVKIDL